jgi:hypothetical protein
MSKGNPVVKLRLSQELNELIELEVRRYNSFTRKEQTTLSGWVRDAIREKLDHLRRGRSKERIRNFRCAACGMRRRLDEIDHMLKPMWGKKEYYCTSCVRVTTVAKSIPPSNVQRPMECEPLWNTVGEQDTQATTDV